VGAYVRGNSFYDESWAICHSSRRLVRGGVWSLLSIYVAVGW